MNPHSVLISLGASFTLLAAVTVLTNGVLLAIFWRNRVNVFRSPTTQFLVGISIANLLTGAITDPLEAYRCFVFFSENGNDSFEDTMMKAHLTSFVSLNASLMMCLGLSVCQTIAVRFPHYYNSWVTKVNIWCWILGTVIVIVIFALFRVMGLSVRENLILETFIMLTIIPFCLTALNFYLYVAYRKQQKSIHVHSEKVGRSEGVAQLRRKRFNKRLTMAAILLVASVLIFTLPESIISYIDIFWINRAREQNLKIIIAEAFVDVFFLLKFALDPVICAWRLPVFRRAFFKKQKFSLERKLKKNNNNNIDNAKRLDLEENSQGNVLFNKQL